MFSAPVLAAWMFYDEFFRQPKRYLLEAEDDFSEFFVQKDSSLSTTERSAAENADDELAFQEAQRKIIEESNIHFRNISNWVAKLDHIWASRKWLTRDDLMDLSDSKPTKISLSLELQLALDPRFREKLVQKLSKAHRAYLHIWLKFDLHLKAKTRNRKFIDNELRDQKTFFDSVDRLPLTTDQRTSVICFDNRVLVVAAAGSGKTSTMVAKAGYAIKRGIVDPGEILMLAFNRAAADELNERVKARLDIQEIDSAEIRCATFHSIGLEIIGNATGKKPRLARFIDQNRDLQFIDEVISKRSESSTEFAKSVALLRSALREDVGEFGAESENYDAWDANKRIRGYFTLAGEIVKSKEERIIADWLFMHGIRYEYESPYEFDVADANHSQYHPDFFYPEIGLYHEHFALDANGSPPQKKGFESYLGSVGWKRALHREKGTALFETTSHGIRNGKDLTALLKELKDRGLYPEFKPHRASNVESKGERTALSTTLRALLSHAKGNRLSVADLRVKIEKGNFHGLRIRAESFLDVFEVVLSEWEAVLKKEGAVDYDDMLNIATDLVRSKRYRNPFRLVLVDEFQDVSVARTALLKALVEKSHQYLFAVGDDWQSINRFAGADSSIMNRFQEIFGDGERLKLEQTFRCPESLARIAADFVTKNPIQIHKEVFSAVPEPGVRTLTAFVYDKDEELPELMERSIGEIFQQVVSGHSADRKVSILILGRYRHDAPGRLSVWRRSFGSRCEIHFSTAHASKGTEADYVFIAPLSSGSYGFPSSIQDDPIIRLAMPAADDFPHSEERRLFYVALTRARRRVLLFAPNARRSDFCNEIIQMGCPVLDKAGNFVESEICDVCGRGKMVKRTGRYGEFLGCSRFPQCPNTQAIR
jgi:DNA helicase-4